MTTTDQPTTAEPAVCGPDCDPATCTHMYDEFFPRRAVGRRTGGDRMTATDLSRFDSDPDALAWTRAKVQRQIDRFRDFERQLAERGEPDKAAQWRKMANMLHRQFIGGDGCVIAAFDERLPAYKAMTDKGVRA